MTESRSQGAEESEGQGGRGLATATGAFLFALCAPLLVDGLWMALGLEASPFARRVMGQAVLWGILLGAVVLVRRRHCAPWPLFEYLFADSMPSVCSSGPSASRWRRRSFTGATF